VCHEEEVVVEEDISQTVLIEVGGYLPL